jgi:fatty-acyl-CoA synthase
MPGQDGRAGMASLVVNDDFDLEGFGEHICRHLPEYSRPLFLRLSKAIDVTGTFKQRRLDLQKQGYDPSVVGDALFFREPGSSRFLPIDAALYRRITKSEVRV